MHPGPAPHQNSAHQAGRKAELIAFVACERAELIGDIGAGTIHQVGIAAGTSSCTLQMLFTPTVNLTYTYQFLVMG